MDTKIKNYIDIIISEQGLDYVKQKNYELLNQLMAFNSKKDGIIDKIELCDQINNYILSIERSNKLQSILIEKKTKVYSFLEFSKFF